MLHCEDKGKEERTIPKTLVTSFTPRQLLLLSKPTNINMKLQEKDTKTTIKSLSSEQRVLLYHSICHFLELNGFLKTLKKFRRETNVEKDGWKNCSLILEEMFQEHLQTRRSTKANVLNTKQKDDLVVPVETVERTKESGVGDGKNSKATSVGGDNIKLKKKKKSGSSDAAAADNVNAETPVEDAGPTVDHTLRMPDEPVKKSKDKKKKHKHEAETLTDDVQEKHAESVTSQKADAVSQEEKSRSKKTKEDSPTTKGDADKEKKVSKKRKKSTPDENETGLEEEKTIDDSKRRKTDDANQSNGIEHSTPRGANGVLEKEGEVKSEKQNKTKERNGSAEPKSVNAFRRVKPDEVEFADERLQDNSYWAKDGADSGYGAKAQEVLGQVRGRGFRHEKTKKKRGSYRGGQIDLQSHSIKFNYGDDDE